MSDRELRKSTKSASERVKLREETRNFLKEIKKRRAAYSGAIDEIETQIDDIESASTADPVDDDDDSSADEYVDPLKAVKSPRKVVLESEVSYGHRSSSCPDTPWSTHNQFFPEGCVTTPVFLAPSTSNLDSSRPSLPSPRLALKKIVEEETDEVFEQEDENLEVEVREEVFDNQEESSQLVEGRDIPVEPSHCVNSSMDDAIFKSKLVQINLEIDKVDIRRQKFTKDDVNLTHKDECLAKLQRIEDAEEACQAKILEFIYELNGTDASDATKIETLRKLSAELMLRVKQNANDVTIKMAELIKSVPMSEGEKASFDLKTKEYEERKALQAKKEADMKGKALIKLKQCREKSSSLIDIIRDEKDVDEMTDQEIRVAISVRSKEWKIDIGKLRKLKE